MASVNKVILVGNLGNDPEVRHSKDGKPIVTLSVATSETWRDKATGEKRENTEWHRIVIFNENICKVAEQYLKKGSKVYLEGQNKTRKWQDKDGNDRYSTEVVLQGFDGKLVLLDRSEGSGFKPGGDGPEDYGMDSARASGNSTSQSGSPANFSNAMDDDIPFYMEWR